MAHFRKLFWGLLLLDLTLCNLHCAFLGYFLLALGAAGLAPVSRQFRRAAVLSWAGLIWCLISVWLPDLVRIGGPQVGEDTLVHPSVRLLIDCLLIWWLAGGIAEYTVARGRPELARRAAHLRIAYLVLSLGTALCLFSGRVAPNQYVTFNDPFGWVLFWLLAWLVWLVMILRLVAQVRREVAVQDEPAAGETDRPWQYSLRTLLLMPLVVWLLMMACFPKLMTGDFCNVRIEKLSVDKDGQMKVNLITRTSSGTETRKRFLPNGGGSEGSGRNFPAWPYDGGSGFGFTLNPDRTPMTAQQMRARLLVEQGKTYRVVPGKPLYFYDFRDKEGIRNCGYLEVEPGSRLGF